jgi:probable rRNA maturation factor
VIELDVILEHDGWSALGGPEPGGPDALARRAVEAAFAVASDAPREDVEISLLLTGDAGVRELNRAWRGQDKPTNVLSFPAPEQPGLPEGLDAGPRHLGDIALAYETLVRESEDEGKTLADHFAHLVVHGVLHLLGYDHELEAQAEIMEALEVRALAALGIANPYRDMAA